MQSDQWVARIPAEFSAVGEIHGHFKADTQVGVGRFGPHGAILLLCRESPVKALMHGWADRRMLLSNEPATCNGRGCTPIKMWELSSPGEAAIAHLRCLCRRHRSLAKARQLPQGIDGVPEILASTKIKCGSCRAPARLRWRWIRRHLQCLYRRHRSLAKARQLPQGIGGGSGISVWMKIKGGSCRAPARLR